MGICATRYGKTGILHYGSMGSIHNKTPKLLNVDISGLVMETWEKLRKHTNYGLVGPFYKIYY